MLHAKSAAHESGEYQAVSLEGGVACEAEVAAGSGGGVEGAPMEGLSNRRRGAGAVHYGLRVNPDLADLLERVGMDKCFVRGEGSLLYDAEGNAYLDAVAGYGAVPFGHNSDSVWQAVNELQRSREPCMVQPSLLAGAGELAEALLRIAPPGLRHVTFANSGTEAVEAAIKACRMASGRLGILSTENGFHGKTLGSLSATGRPFFQEGSGAPARGFRRIPFGDLDALEDELAQHGSELAAFIVEPIQGEGGVIEAPAGYLRGARKLCDKRGVLLIVDEIQTGLGRTGALFACLDEGVTPDVLTVAKALGGGLVPVAACILAPGAYSRSFALRHSSTFAGNALAMRVGLRVVERLSSGRENLLEQVARRGMYLKRGLSAVRLEHPSVIRDVRGRGLMLGVELAADPSAIRDGSGGFAAALAASDGLAPFAASYLLNACRLRVAPTLNGGNVLRVQPPLTVSREECDWIIRSFGQLAGLLAARRSDQLVSHLVRRPERAHVATVVRLSDARVRSQAPLAEEGRFAFVAHMLDGASITEFDRSLSSLRPSELDDLSTCLEPLAGAFFASRVRIESITGQTATGDFIVIPKTAEQLLRLSHEEAFDEVAAAVQLGKERGALIVGLGGYTSVVAQNLRALLRLGVSLTTGNSYTVVSAVDAAMAAARITERRLEQTRAAIVGGGGSIGSALAGLLAERVASLALVAREGDAASVRSREAVVLARMMRHLARHQLAGGYLGPGTLGAEMARLEVAQELGRSDERFGLNERTERKILEAVRGLPIRWTTDLEATVCESDQIFLVTSSPKELVHSRMVRSGSVVCDLSRPPNVSPDLANRDDVIVIDGGIVEVPGQPDLGFHFGLSRGHAFACMAETMMLALEHRYEHTSLGRDLREDTLALLRGLATKHGFRLAELRSRGRPLSVSLFREAAGTCSSPSPLRAAQ
ncbi:MAG: aminotransferase class III-fold pyridoxal phosphate-dependent enzyme [Myxococcales bacterium]|nr:aminotransferase class III-fold pyridoxal phosphate-dependent enzyme [Myxococcales bacterium]